MDKVLLLLPEIFLIIITIALVLSEISYFGEKLRLVSSFSLLGLAAALAQVFLSQPAETVRVFGQTLSFDYFSFFFRIFFILLGIFLVFLASFSKEIPRAKQAEFILFVVIGVLGGCLVSLSADLFLSFLSLQMMVVSGLFISGFLKKDHRSVEGAIKGYVFFVISAVLMIFAFALVFTQTHSLNLFEIKGALQQSPFSESVAVLSFLFFLLSICSTVGMFPMHFWLPDAVEGAPTPTSAFLLLMVPAAFFALIIRFFVQVYGIPDMQSTSWPVLGTVHWSTIMGFFAGVTMLVGSLMAIRQKAMKRMLAFLMISQFGFWASALLSLDARGISGLFYLLVVDLFSIVGVYLVLCLFTDRLGNDDLDSLAGHLRKYIPESVGLLFFLGCLIGLPPFPGFFGKFILVVSLSENQWSFLCVVMLLATVFNAIAFAQVALSLCKTTKTSGLDAEALPRGQKILLLCLVIPIVLIGIFAQTVLHWTSQTIFPILW